MSAHRSQSDFGPDDGSLVPSHLTFGSLFSGIGGLDLGLERAGWRCVWQSEIHPYASRVLSKHWPTVPNLGDITKIDWSTVEQPDLICGGYPCQPFSEAGKREGDADSRHLWPYFASALRVLRPRWALLENVSGHLSLGLDGVLADLAALGFDAEWSVVSACSVGASHMRERVFVVAHHDSDDGGTPWALQAEASPAGLSFDAGQPHRGGGRPAAWAPEPGVGRVADGVPRRVDRLRGLGNAVVPQVVEHIGRRLMEEHLAAA